MTRSNESFFHDTWLGMVQQDGLVVSVPVLTAAGLMYQRGAAGQRAYRERLHPPAGEAGSGERVRLELPSLDVLLFELLEWTRSDVDLAAQLPATLHVVAADAATSAIIRPSAALRRTPRIEAPLPEGAAQADDDDDDPFAASDVFAAPKPAAAPVSAPEPSATTSTDPELSSAAHSGRDYLVLVWDLADPVTGFGPAALGRPFDRPDHETDWSYPPAAKFERLLRHARVSIGLLTNRTQVRLIYAPHGETSGSITFDLTDMSEVGGRPILDGFLSLLGRDRLLTQAVEHRLPALLAASRKQQAEVTERLADQVFEALSVLLDGFERAAARDGSELLATLVAQHDGQLYAGLLSVLLRLVFMLYAEDRALLPVEHPIYQTGYALLGLFDELEQDQGAHPDAMDRRFGAWSRLIATWRAIYDGIHHDGEGDEAPLIMPPRRGHLFDPDAYPFLEGRDAPAGAHELGASERAAVPVPSIDDGTIHQVLDALLFLRDGNTRQRLSYRALDVEQIGSVYEALMGYDVVRLAHPALRLRARRAKGVWLSAEELLAVAPAQRAKWLKDEVGLDKAAATKLADAVGKLKDREQVLDIIQAHAGGKAHGQRAAAGRLVIQPGDERKRTSSHYTPRELTEPVVRRTLAPILRTMEAVSGGLPSSDSLLNLKIVDPAMGSGAFLVEVVRQLGDHVVAAWQREGGYEHQGPLIAAALGGLSVEARPSEGETDEADPVIAARRLVAQRCVYGVDKNPYAVNLAKLSLWLVTMSRSLPFTFVDHALRQGDSLVGLSLDQIRAFHWQVDDAAPAKGKKKGKLQIEDPVLTHIVAQSLARATELRRKIVELARTDGEDAVLERERLLADAREALEDARLGADLCLSAFFATTKDKERLAERTRRLDLLTSWLGAREREDAQASGRLRGELERMRGELLKGQAPFHWMLEFPEVFWEGRPDPLEGGKKNQVAFFDAVVGNPPFMGGSQLSGSFGDGYRDWLLHLHAGAHGNSDLCAHFFRRAEMLLGPHGALGLVATNTIGQGDTRTTGLAALIKNGAVIYDATINLMWPAPGAAVTVCVVHMATGSVAKKIEDRVRRVDETKSEGFHSNPVRQINSYLDPRAEPVPPVRLDSNDGLSSVGSKVYGQGFTLTPEEREELVERNRRNAELIKPYLGGAEVNSNPNHGFDRYVIDFGERTLEQAEEWPDLISLIREKVKPERDQNKREARRKYWWMFGERAPALYAALANLPRCLVASIHSKHLLWSPQNSTQVFSHALVVLPLETSTALAILQSRIHERWARALGSSMKTDLRYAPSDCFQNFPFPAPDPRTEHPKLEPLGAALDAQRSAFMLDHQIGLTTTYNLLLGFDLDAIVADPAHKHHAPATDPRLATLRSLHLELDRAVLDTYAECLAASKDAKERELAPLFSAIAVPPYLDPRLPNLAPADKLALEQFNDAILDALMALNEVRAAQERRGKA